MASAVDSRLAYARLSAVATASRLPTATRGSNNSYTTSWDTTDRSWPRSRTGTGAKTEFVDAFTQKLRSRWLAPDVTGAKSLKSWCPGADSNHRHADFQSAALPTELPGRGRRAPRLIRKSAWPVEPPRAARPGPRQPSGATPRPGPRRRAGGSCPTGSCASNRGPHGAARGRHRPRAETGRRRADNRSTSRDCRRLAHR